MSNELSLPAVYVGEIRQHPPSIVDEPTAVPVFVGYTARARAEIDDDLHLRVTRVESLAAYEDFFGGPHAESMSLALTSDPASADGYSLAAMVPVTMVPAYSLYWAVKQFFDNGGVPCYIASVGGYREAPGAEALLDGLARAANSADVTLIVVPDAATLQRFDEYQAVVSAMLRQCGTLGGRFAIIDVWRGDLACDAPVDVSSHGAGAAHVRNVIDASRAAWSDHLEYGAAYYPFITTVYTRGMTTTDALVTVKIDGVDAGTLRSLASREPRKANTVRRVLGERNLVLPPSGAVAGIYGIVDESRGVWKAPANVQLAATRGPVVSITPTDQEQLSVDVGTGKSINVIRTFVGRGTVVWGARTLAGNDTEWRYVPIRRFVDSVQKSIRLSTAWVVFERNGPALWTRLNLAVEDYLTEKWHNGALAGRTTDEAFFVHCGQDTTMTQQDVDAGYVIVQVGMALATPAEFTIFTLTYRLQAE